MTIYNYILTFLSTSIYIFGIYYLFALLFIHKKFNSLYLYHVINCFIGGSYILFQLLLSLDFSDQQYLWFHKAKLLALMVSIPLQFLTMFKIFYPTSKMLIPKIMSGFTLLILITLPFNIFNSLPIQEVIINNSVSTFVYNLSTPNLTYKIYMVGLLLSFLSSIVYYFISKNRKRNIRFVIPFVAYTIGAINDVGVVDGLFYNILITEYMVFAYIIILLVHFLNQDRKTYLSEINLNKELLIYKNELEIKVEQRTKEVVEKSKIIEEEKEKSDKLLLNVLPEQIANRLKSGEKPIADHFEEASVIFIDIADFTKLSERIKPQNLVIMLSEIFSIFDKISAKYGLEKIKTIGDCYMAAAGIPIPRKDHAEAVANMSIEVMETMKDYCVQLSESSELAESWRTIQFRIGLDCGPIVAGVIGEQKFIYDLWGDMVNTASRMESNGVIGKIQVTERFKNKLVDSGQLSVDSKFRFEERGEIEIKGKGMMKTYFLVDSRKSIVRR